MKNLLVSSLLIITAISAHAKDWASGGGGELASDGENPWFAHNTTVVPYCIKIDDQHFGASLDEARTAVSEATQFWKQSFSTRIANTDVKMGAQEFVEVECHVPHLMTLQFGVLTAKQHKEIANPKRIVAAAIGEGDYDTVNLRRHGFIYVSPESGPLALEDQDLVSNRWQRGNGRLLKLALIHEFGHVFGAQHRNVSGGVMDRFVLAKSISKHSFENYLKASVIPNPFNPVEGNTYRQCDRPKFLANLLNLKEIPDCFEFTSPRRGKVQFYSFNRGDSNRSLLGTFNAQFEGNGAEVGSWFFLTDDQRVFPHKPDGTKLKSVMAANYVYWEESGFYQSADESVKRQMILTYSGEEIDGTVMDANGQAKLHAISGDVWN